MNFRHSVVMLACALLVSAMAVMSSPVPMPVPEPKKMCGPRCNDFGQ
jgi:hypothetical protein